MTTTHPVAREHAPADAPAGAPAIPIVGIAGYTESGKNTAAVPLIAYGFVEHRFKTAILDFCRELNALLPDGRRWTPVLDEVGYEDAKDTVPGFNEVIQDVGLAARRALNADVWADAAMRELEPQVVFTDCRFPNEAQAIVDRGGVVVRITRPGAGPFVRADGTVPATETALDDWDYDLHITNDGTALQLQMALMLGLQQIADARRGEISPVKRLLAS